MIKRIRVRGYQSHVDTDLVLGKFTVIYGPSDNGKSAFYRAIKDAVQNQAGVDFINWNMDKCQVVFEVEDSIVVAWEKSAKVNKYSVIKPGQKKEEYAKLKSTVPQEVASIMRFALMKVDKDDFLPNFSDQFDQPFLVFFSGYKIAKVVGQLTGADILFQASREIRNRERKTRQDIVTGEAIIEKTKLDLVKYDGIDDRMKFVRGVIGRTDGVLINLNKFDSLSKLWMNTVSVANQVKVLKDLLNKQTPVVQQLKSKMQFVNNGVQGLQTLKGYWGQAKNLAIEVQRINLEVQSKVSVEKVLASKVVKIGSAVQRLEKLCKVKTELDLQVADEVRSDKNLKEYQRRHMVIKSEIIEFQEVNNVCPLCQKPWSESVC